MIIQPSRRKFLQDVGLLLAAPAIVRASSLMPVQALPNPWLDRIGQSAPFWGSEFIVERVKFTATERFSPALLRRLYGSVGQ